MRDDRETKLAFKNMLTEVWGAYEKTMSGPVMAIYWNALQGYELDDIRRALSLHITNPDNGQFTPKPADLIRVLTGTNANKGAEAWSKVLGAIKTVGPYHSVIFDDAIIHAVIVDMGGWIGLNNVTDEDLPFRANEFEKRYQGLAMRGGAKNYPRKLTGISEADNARLTEVKIGIKMKPQDPIAIGDKAAAILVYDGGEENKAVLGSPVSVGSIAGSVMKRIDSQ